MTRIHRKKSIFRCNNHSGALGSQGQILLIQVPELKSVALLTKYATDSKCSKLNWPRNKLQLNSILLKFIFLLIRKSDRKHNQITITIQCFDIGNHLLIAGFVFGDRDKKKNK